MKNARFVNELGGILITQDNGIDLYLDSGDLYDQFKGVAAPYDKPLITQAELDAIKMAKFEIAVQDYLDQGAKSLGYDDINSIAKYLVIDNPFYNEASILSLWAAEVWVYSFSQMQVYKGELDAFLLTLPKLEV